MPQPRDKQGPWSPQTLRARDWSLFITLNHRGCPLLCRRDTQRTPSTEWLAGASSAPATCERQTALLQNSVLLCRSPDSQPTLTSASGLGGTEQADGRTCPSPTQPLTGGQESNRTCLPSTEDSQPSTALLSRGTTRATRGLPNARGWKCWKTFSMLPALGPEKVSCDHCHCEPHLRLVLGERALHIG